jgi:hypothetical protein
MSIQTNFRAQDMLGVAKPTKRVAPAPRIAPPAPVVEPVVVTPEPAVSVVEESFQAPAPEVNLED